MKKIIIIGASFAGLSCAKALLDSGMEILVLEKSSRQNLGIKTCASGVTKQDLAFISEEEMNFPLEPVYLCVGEEKSQMPMGRGMISSIMRPEILHKWLTDLTSNKNIEIRFDSDVVEITACSVKIKNGEEFGFDYLVGADGSLSKVRQFLNIPREKYLPSVQYILPQNYPPKFEIYADEDLFDKGYAWIFPNNGFTSVGACVTATSPNAKKIRLNLNTWLEKQGIDVKNGQFEGFIINYDYRGYKFGNIFLTGDAAGLTNGLTGKGIYAACLSGKIAAQVISDTKPDYEKLDKWLIEKEEDEKELKLEGNFIKRKIDSLEN